MSKKKIGMTFLIVVIVWLVIMARMDFVPYLDHVISNYVEDHVGTSVYSLALNITELGSRSFLIPFTIIVGLLIVWLFKDWVPAIFFALGTLFSHLLGKFIKILVGRERPNILLEANAEGFSFPSGHSLTPVVCYGFLLFLLLIKIKSNRIRLLLQIVFVLLIILIGLSRIVLNVHFFTDVVGGFLIGLLFLVALIKMYSVVESHRQR